MNYFIESVDKVKQPFLGTWNNSQQGVTLSLVFCSYFLQLYWISLRTQVWPELCLSACAAWATEVTDPRLQWQDSRSPPPPVLAILIIASFFAIKSSQPQCSQYCLLSLSSSFAYKRCCYYCYYNCVVMALLSHLLLAALGWPVKEDASREGRNIFLRLRRDTAWASLIRA